MEPIRVSEDFYEQTPDANALATEAVMNAIRTADQLLDRIGRLLRPLGVSSAGGLVLGQLRDHGPLSPSEIGERLIVTRATVTGVLDSLERRGYVRRSPNPVDRRGVIVDLTAEGLVVVAEVRRLVHLNEKQWMTVLSDEELDAYIGLLQRIQARVAPEADEAG
jgi:DNA-binding MarR family transcriptional regulator